MPIKSIAQILNKLMKAPAISRMIDVQDNLKKAAFMFLVFIYKCTKDVKNELYSGPKITHKSSNIY